MKGVESPSGDTATVSHALRPNFPALGPIFGQRTKAVAAGIRRIDADAAVTDLRDRGWFGIDAVGQTIESSSGCQGAGHGLAIDDASRTMTADFAGPDRSAPAREAALG
jgi:hypothetical protein